MMLWLQRPNTLGTGTTLQHWASRRSYLLKRYECALHIVGESLRLEYKGRCLRNAIAYMSTRIVKDVYPDLAQPYLYNQGFSKDGASACSHCGHLVDRDLFRRCFHLLSRQNAMEPQRPRPLSQSVSFRYHWPDPVDSYRLRYLVRSDAYGVEVANADTSEGSSDLLLSRLWLVSFGSTCTHGSSTESR